ncbi:DUF423 domain-containing protein [Pseudaminobacter soli (ex Li et al. 2025)]|uniref:DUF423 domain-containing protein n=1 Tax=Pseudaminobacter soli (ex Li et al. 2025) TaxID=1295366 RepID=A0A2P7S5W0_9HYPH|nr:DUF423 domain-containing protein [Mesorhizobium soli]PSJ57837.1 DUF423 domain-containing protein [Mesorhizobium soli]
MHSDRFLLGAGGLAGAAGVVVAALATHAGGAHMQTASNFLLMTAPALLAIGLMATTRLLRFSGFVLLAGLILFAGDLLARDYLGDRLFPYAAPIGGTLLILGWLLVFISAFLRPQRG